MTKKKTAFCPGPGMGLFQFKRMPFGLTGAPSSFQRLMDTVLRGLPFVTIYLDDILVHSPDEEIHRSHLRQVFDRLRAAGLVLRGKKCHIGLSAVDYLGHVFSGSGMAPDPKKIQAVLQLPEPTDVTTLRHFLGLASYYRRYIHQFSDIAAPLNQLTQKGVTFVWDQKCKEAFITLKQHLISAPILMYPSFDQSSPEFCLQTDASAVGIGAVLEQGGHVIAYASRSLTQPERHYSVIQRECLAIVYAVKQFRHYLLGRQFKLFTDHAPLQWLSAQKMEGMLCRWALALQEYNFQVVYRKGSLNANADALSRLEGLPCSVAISVPAYSNIELTMAQQADPDLSKVIEAGPGVNPPPRGHQWNKYPLHRYVNLWSQLRIIDGALCRRYVPNPSSDPVTVPILPRSMQKQALLRTHNIPSAGHQGSEKTLQRLRQEAYWVNIARDVIRHCQECVRCQQSKLTMPQRAPLTNIPIGKPWEMIAVDILEVPISRNNNRYLLVVQDYFTKWAEAIPLPDQTANRITAELIKLFSTFGQPDILHSDQGRNFESTVLAQALEAFGVKKSRTTAYHPQGDGMVERFNRSLLQLLRTYVDHQDDWERYLPLVLYAYRTSLHSSTGCSPFSLMYGRDLSQTPFNTGPTFDPSSYSNHLKKKMAELRDFVESNLAARAHSQKSTYDEHAAAPTTFSAGNAVWLSIPTAGKLDPRWEGGWVVQSVKSPLTIEITRDNQQKVVHVNRLRHRIQPSLSESENTTTPQSLVGQQWQPPGIDHISVPVPPPAPTLSRRYPERQHQPPVRYGT